MISAWRMKKIRKSTYESLHRAIPILLFYLNKNWNYAFSLSLYCGHYQQVLYNLCLFLLLRHGIQETKKHSPQARLCVLLKKKKKFCLMKSNQFDFIHYTEIIFLSKNVIILYILKIFFTMLHLRIFLKYWRILYIFRISLCVTSP